MHCYIKDGKVIATSEELIPKRDEENLIDGLVYDEAIETYLEGQVEYSKGKIIKSTQEPETERMSAKEKAVDTLVSSELKNLTHESLNGQSFSDFEVGELIVKKFFGGNPHAQSARFAEINAIQLAFMTGSATDEDKQRLAEIQSLYTDISKFKNLFYV